MITYADKNWEYKDFRTLYFNNFIDIRLCPKNANTTLKYCWNKLINNENSDVSPLIRADRYQYYLKLGQIKSNDNEFLFRTNSYKIAIKRDPIKRALSAATWILQAQNIINPTIKQIELCIDTLCPNNDFHFYTQYFWMGVKDQYDEIYDIKDVNKLLDFLEKDYPYKTTISNRHKNKSKASVESKQLSDKILNKLKTIYQIDYDNGWC